jgi:hypothetical protein
MTPSSPSTNPDQEKRTAKALACLAAGSMQVRPTADNTWRVKNGDHDPHIVIRADGTWACDCPDWTGRCRTNDLRCHHIEAVRLSPPLPPGTPLSPKSQTQKETIHLMNDETQISTPQDELKTITEALATPFPAASINWKPQAVSKDKTRALAVAYIDARDVMDRLDEVVGAFNWQVEHVEACGQLVTRIGIKNPLNSEWVWKSDLGFISGSDSDKEDDQVKAIKGTPSDGLKRAGVEWGIARYLYKLPKVWVEFDAEKKQLKSTPILPLWAVPENERRPKGKPSGTNGSNGHNSGKGNSAALIPTPPPNGSPPANGHSSSPSQPNPDEIAKARALVMTLGSDAVKGKPLGELGRDVWDYLATSQFKGEEALALQKAAQLLIAAAA